MVERNNRPAGPEIQELSFELSPRLQQELGDLFLRCELPVNQSSKATIAHFPDWLSQHGEEIQRVIGSIVRELTRKFHPRTTKFGELADAVFKTVVRTMPDNSRNYASAAEHFVKIGQSQLIEIYGGGGLPERVRNLETETKDYFEQRNERIQAGEKNLESYLLFPFVQITALLRLRSVLAGDGMPPEFRELKHAES